MSFRRLTRAVLETPSCHRLLAQTEKRPFGRRILQYVGRRHGMYGTFAEAWKAAAMGRYAGHDHASNLANHLNLAKNLRPSDYAALYWLSRIEDDLNIFDFGGNVGNLYYSYFPYLSVDEHRVDWTVYDLPKTIEEGRKIAGVRSPKGLRFTGEMRSTHDYNVLLISGALHYWEDSIEVLFERLSHRPAHVVLNRTPMHATEPSFITIQRFDDFAMPCIVRNANELVDSFKKLGYSLINRWEASELSIRMPLFPEKSVAHYSGFYFRKM